MSRPVRTSILIRVQAEGGKFLGDDIGGASITVRNTETGEVLATGVTAGDSGQVCPEYRPGTSRQVIVTPADKKRKKPTIQWLEPGPDTSRFFAEFALERPALLEISAFGPLGGLQTAHRVAATQWIVPGEHRTADPGFVLTLPGLLVQVMEPATHLKLAEPRPLTFKANVTMMCGCQIAKDGYWISSDFEVTARIRQVGSSRVMQMPLALDKRQPSIFSKVYEMKRPKGKGPTYFEVTVVAVQKSTGNTGAGLVTLILDPT